MNKCLFFILFSIFCMFNAQTVPSCMEEDLQNHTFMSCGFHTTIMKTANGFQIFGAIAAPNGKDNLLYPTDISPKNGFNYEGEILHATLGDHLKSNNSSIGNYELARMFILTTKGLYTWGKVGTTVSSSLISSTDFQKMNLPDAVNTEDIKKIEASYAGLVVLTFSGDVYVLGIKPELFGDGDTDIKKWHKANINNVKYLSTADCGVFAYTHDGKYYTWGTNIFIGNNSLPKTSSYTPLEMTPPFNGEPKMIVVGQGIYYALSPESTISTLGYNNIGLLGTGTLNSMETKWVNVLNTAGTDLLRNVIFINTTNNYSAEDPYNTRSSGAITADGTLYLWGKNDSYLISDIVPEGYIQRTPITPSGFTSGKNIAVYVENGGHITPYVDSALKKYGYVGHLVHGSMGNGNNNTYTKKYDLINTPDIEFCFIAELSTTIICNQVDFNLDISESNYRIDWNFGDNSPISTTTNISHNSHTYEKNGSYKVELIIYYRNNKIKIINKTINIVDIPVITTIDQQGCGEVMLNPITVPDNYTVEWKNQNNNIINPKIPITESGIFTITVTSDKGCTNSKTINVTIHPIPVINAGDQQGCGEIMLDSGEIINGYSVVWKDQNNSIINPNNPITESGIFTITVTSDKGCTNSKTINVTIHPIPVITAGDQQGCGEVMLDSGEIFNGYSVEWKDQNNNIINPKNPITNSGKFTITVTSDKGCTNSKIINVTIHPIPIINAGDQQGCGEVILNPITVPDNYTVEWKDQNNSIINPNNPITESGKFTITVTSDKGCTNSKTINVTVHPIPVINTGDQQGCGEVMLDSGEIFNGYSVEWKDQNNSIINPNNPITKSGIFTITVTSDKGCTNSKTINVTIYPVPIINAVDQQGCGEVMLNSGEITNGYSVVWKDQNYNIIDPKNPITESGKFTITVTSNKGCTNSKTINVTIHPIPVINAGDQQGCGEVMLDSGEIFNGYSVEWKDQNNSIINPKNPITKSGIFTITVTSDKGCTNSKTINVTIYPVPIINAVDQQGCGEVMLNSGEITNGYSVVWKDQNYNIIDPKNPITESGKFTITVTSDKGCTNSKTIIVTIHPIPVINAGDQQGCGEVMLDSGEITNGYSVVWKDQNNSIINPNNPITESGIFTITVTSDKGCTNSKNINVTIQPIPIINAGDQQGCGEVILNPITVPDNYTVVWKDQNNSIINPNNPITKSGKFTITVTSNKGCTNSKTINVTIHPIPVINAVDQQGCGEVMLDSGDIFNGYSVVWKDQNNNIINPKNPITESGKFTITVTSDKGCTNSKTINVTIHPIPVINAGDQQGCGEVMLNSGEITNGYSVVWKNQNNNIINPKYPITESGKFTITVTSDKGCTNSKTINVTIHPIPVINAGDQQGCGEVILNPITVPDNYIVEWKDQNNSIINPNNPITESGKFTITVTSDKGCTNSKTINVTIHPIPVINAGDQQGCGKVMLDSGEITNGYSVIWKDQNNSIINPNNPITESGKFTITVTSDKGCTNSKTINVTIHPIPVINAGDQQGCGEVMLNPITVPDNYTVVWKDQNNNIIDPKYPITESGKFTITVTSDKGCTNSKTINVTIHPIPVINAGDQQGCGEIMLDSGEIINGYSVVWKDQNNNIIDPKNPITKSGKFTITVTSDKGCTNSKTINVTIHPVPVFTAEDQQACEKIILNPVIVPDKYSVVWKDQNNNIIDPKISITKSGKFTITVTSDKGCTNSKTINVTIYPVPVINAGDQQGCGEVMLNSGEITNGYSLVWKDQNNNIIDPKIPITESGIFTITVTSDKGCTNSKTIIVTIHPVPVFTAEDQQACEKIILNPVIVPDNYTVEWKDQNNNIIDPKIPITESGKFTITVTSDKGCTNSKTIIVTVHPLPIINLGPDKIICKGESITLNAGNTGSTFKWNTGEKSQSITVSKSGNYSVTVINANGCKASGSIKITVSEIPYIQEVKTKNNSIQIIASGKQPLQYSIDLNYWQYSPVFQNLSENIYKIYVKNENDCISDGYIYYAIKIPNSITPNGDGINDTWNLNGLEAYPGSKIKIFDRYGKILIDKNFDQNPVWDGKYLGQVVPTGSCWYIIELPNGEKITGWLLVRNYN